MPPALPFSRVVAATDFSERAAHAASRAAMLAAHHGAPLELVHVIQRRVLDELRWLASPTELGERLCKPAREAIEALAASLQGLAASSTHVEVGDVVEAIAARASADALLVVGAHGEHGLRDLLLGSTAERLLGRDTGPVLVVKGAPVAPYGKILAALDLQAGSAEVLDAASRISPAATTTAAHAYDVPFEGMLHRAGLRAGQIDGHRGEALRRALADIDALVHRVAPEPHRVLPLAQRGHAAKFVLDTAASLQADLIVLGRHRRTLAERAWIGSVARRVIAAASCDVLVAAPAP